MTKFEIHPMTWEFMAFTDGLEQESIGHFMDKGLNGNELSRMIIESSLIKIRAALIANPEFEKANRFSQMGMLRDIRQQLDVVLGDL